MFGLPDRKTLKSLRKREQEKRERMEKQVTELTHSVNTKTIGAAVGEHPVAACVAAGVAGIALFEVIRTPGVRKASSAVLLPLAKAALLQQLANSKAAPKSAPVANGVKNQ